MYLATYDLFVALTDQKLCCIAVMLECGLNFMNIQNKLCLIVFLIVGGALLDMGCYTLQFAQMVYKHEKPEVIATGFLNENSKYCEKPF